ncbi:hypothetical protein J53TS2_27720 [Paenibacillus sp. J53TS2]|nr:hypothetical protein J53TS2_27720 [Paenibacillus sp. J53TS2]
MREAMIPSSNTDELPCKFQLAGRLLECRVVLSEVLPYNGIQYKGDFGAEECNRRW